MKLKKIDVIIIVILIIVSTIVLFRAKIIEDPRRDKPPEIHFLADDANKKLIVTYVSTIVRWDDLEIIGNCDKSKLGSEVVEGDELTSCYGIITITHSKTGIDYGSWTFTKEEKLPTSLTIPEQRVVSPEDEGAHYKTKLLTQFLVNREWWYYTVVFSNNCPLAGWTATISFNHMARGDLFYEKPDLLVVTLQSPSGEVYGGIEERERPLLGDYSYFSEPILQTSSSEKMFKVSFENSYVQGRAPNWFVHVDGKIGDNNIVMDLTYKAESSPLWTYSNMPIDKSKGTIASYIFMGCDVQGKVKLDGIEADVNGIGHHEHTWVSGLLSSGIIRGWDWCHMTLENGWNIYYSNYYLSPELQSTKKHKFNPFGNIIITSDQGETVTFLEDIEVDIMDSDKLFLFKNIPNNIRINADTSITQLLISEYDIKLNLNIKSENTLNKEWARFARVGMKIGQSEISGKITWKDNNVNHEIDLVGIGTIWNMRH